MITEKRWDTGSIQYDRQHYWYLCADVCYDPAVGTSITFLIFAGILLALSIVYFVMEKAGKKKVIASVLIFAFCCGTGYSDSFAFWGKQPDI